MPSRAHYRHRLAALVAVLAVVLPMQALLAPSASVAAQGFVPISGSGSTWSQNAVDQWRRNVNNLYGITVNFAGNGSTAGRNDFRFGQVDFAVSEIPYGLKEGGVVEAPPDRAFGYMPIVAGGTAVMYNLKIGNKRVTNLRLSGETITKIFAQQITNWSDPAIKADNPGLTLPPRKIVPVVRSDGSGTSAQFTAWMADQHGGIWDDYCRRAGRQVPCGFTSFFPSIGSAQGKAGSQGVAGFVAQDSSEGAITYVEYSYARNSGFPVVKVLNKANYYAEPKADSVAVALLKAKINPDLTQNLRDVYNDPDPRAYPMSSYSYMIVPQGEPSNGFTREKGRTLSEFAYYFLCEGQRQADALGFSPLPVNLVQAGVDQVNKIPGATQLLNRNNLSKCNNPTFSPDGTNLLAKNAKQPSECDRKGVTQCETGTGGATATTPNSGGGGNNGGNTSGGSNNGGGGGNNGSNTGDGGSNTGNGGNTGSGDAGTGEQSADGTGADGGAAGEIDPDTGEQLGGPVRGSGSTVSAVPVTVDLADNRRQAVLGVLAVVLLLGLVLGPPLVARTMRAREGPQA